MASIEQTVETRIGVRELRENLSGILRRVQRGSSVLITVRDEVIAELRPPTVLTRRPRTPGALKGEIWMTPDFTTTPDDLIDVMEGRL